MATLHVVTGDQYRMVSRRMREILRQLDQDGGSPLDPNAVARDLQQIIEGQFLVTVYCNYGEQDAIANAISENNFASIDLGLSAAYIPLLGSGKVYHEVGEICIKDKYLTELGAIEKIGERGYKFATPLAALRYAARRPDRYPLAVIFEFNGQCWHLLIRMAQRTLTVGHSTRDDARWCGGYNLLVVPK